MTAVHDAVTRITGGAHRRLVESGRAARTVTVKIRSADFTTHTRSETATLATTDLGTLTAVAQRLARAAVGEGGVRLIGVSLAGLGDEPPPGAVRRPRAGRPRREPGGRADRQCNGRRDPRRLGGRGRRCTGEQPDRFRLGDADLRGSLRCRKLPTPSRPGPEDGRPLRAAAPGRGWRPGDDVTHVEFGHGWVQGAGHGRVTVRFETRSTGPGRARTLAADDPALHAADPLGSLS